MARLPNLPVRISVARPVGYANHCLELGNFAAVQYDDTCGFPASIEPGSPAREADFYGGGYSVDDQIISFGHQAWRKLDV